MTTTTLTTGQVITYGDGRLACPVKEIYKSINEMLEDNIYTHQLPRALEFVQPHVVESCPWVTNLPPMPDTEGLEGDRLEEVFYGWVERISELHGTEHEVTVPTNEWVHIDPVEELAMVMPVTVINTTNEDNDA